MRAGGAFWLPGNCYRFVAVAAHASVRRLRPGMRGAAKRSSCKDCQGCHGPDGKGGGKGFMPHVGPLARKGYIETMPDEYLAAVIAEGGARRRQERIHAVLEDTLTQQDIADVIAFIRTFVVE